MKKLSTLLIIAFALVLGLTQCKKKVDTIATPSDLGKTVYITVNVGDGDRHIVYPGTGAVVYTDGDIIYVGDGSIYLGSLEYESGKFSGTINEPAEGDYLYFYFLGGLTPSATPVAGTTTDFTVSIANQSSKLPVLSFGRSTSTYTTSTATYGCTLLNKCGLVKFVPAAATSEPVRVHGMKTTATINFANPGITPTNATGTITLYPEPGSNAKWAILLPQDEVSNPEGIIGKYACTMESVPGVTENMYYTSVNMDAAKPGMLGGLFTINENGGKVHFSQGNLQAVGTTTSLPASGWTWSFATNQYDYIDDAAANTSINGNGTVSEDGTVDLFGWSTAATYYGINNSTNNGDYSDGFVDWGGTIGNSWRTLTSDEWMYLFNGRSAIGVETRFAKAYLLGSFHGVILFPDNYTHPEGVAAPTGVNVTGNTSWNANQYNADDWGKMEAAGCVFLPAAGYRNGSSVSYFGSNGFYWSSSHSDATRAYRVSISSDDMNPQNISGRGRGFSVRLARVVE